MVHGILSGERKTGQKVNSMSAVLKYICEYVKIGNNWKNVP